MATRLELGSENWELIQRLADRRLVVTGRDSQSGADTVEVVHEALIQRWGKLQDWMQVDRLFRTWQERLRAALRQWEASQRDNGALLRGGPLVNAEEWLESRGAELAESEREYIRAGAALRASEQYQRERRRRNTFLALGAGLVVALILAAVAFLAFRKAQVASLRAGQQQAIAEEQLQLSTSRSWRLPQLPTSILTRNAASCWHWRACLGRIHWKHAMHCTRRYQSFVSCIAR